MIEIGDMAPDLRLQNQDEETVGLEDFRGRRVLLFAYPKANTSGCTKQACGFRDNMPAIEAADAVVLGISPDQPKALKNWKEKEGLPYDLLSDPEHQLLDALGAWGEKSMYGRKYMGVIRSHFIFDAEGRLVEARRKVSPAKSVELGTKFLADS